MDIRERAKNIANYLLEKASKYGTFKNSYPATYGELGEILKMSSKECRLCCEYLESKGYIEVTSDPDGNGSTFLFKAKPAVIDFLESNPG